MVAEVVEVTVLIGLPIDVLETVVVYKSDLERRHQSTKMETGTWTETVLSAETELEVRETEDQLEAEEMAEEQGPLGATGYNEPCTLGKETYSQRA